MGRTVALKILLEGMCIRAEHQGEEVTCQLIANRRKIQLVGAAYKIICAEEIGLVCGHCFVSQRSLVEKIIVNPEYRDVLKSRHAVWHIQKHIVAIFQYLFREGKHHQLLVAVSVAKEQIFFSSVYRIEI